MHEFSTLAVMIQERQAKDFLKFHAKVGLGVRAVRPFVRALDESQVLGRVRTGLYMPAYGLREARPAA